MLLFYSGNPQVMIRCVDRMYMCCLWSSVLIVCICVDRVHGSVALLSSSALDLVIFFPFCPLCSFPHRAPTWPFLCWFRSVKRTYSSSLSFFFFPGCGVFRMLLLFWAFWDKFIFHVLNLALFILYGVLNKLNSAGYYRMPITCSTT